MDQADPRHPVVVLCLDHKSSDWSLLLSGDKTLHT